MGEVVALDWPEGHLEVALLAGMLVDLRFDLPDGSFRPLAPRQWDDPGEGLPGHLRVLGGDFACVPFGSAVPAHAPGWPSGPADDPPHGHGAEVEWRVERAVAGELLLACDYPPESPVRGLRRRLRAAGSTVESCLTVAVRRDCTLPVGLHPILRLPDRGDLLLEADFAAGFTYPVAVHPASRTAAGERFTSLADVPGAAGAALDLRRLPLDGPTEDVVLLTGVVPPVIARYGHERADVFLYWDAAALPSMLLWLSDRALQEHPWSGRYRGLGLEPVRSAFDLPSAVSSRPNPLSEAGVSTAARLTPERPLTISSSIRAARAGSDNPLDAEGPAQP